MPAEAANHLQQTRYSYSRWKLYFSAISASCLFISSGLFMGWPSPSLVLLKPRNYTSLEYSLLASLPGLAPGPLITMFGIDLIGRKNTLLVIWSTLMGSWIIMTVSDKINALLVARFVGGWGMAASFSAIGIYISEISDVYVRGPLNSVSTIFLSIGNIIISCVGPFTSLEVITLTSAAITLIFIIFFWFMPESPYHLVNKGNMVKAHETLTWLRVKAEVKDIDDELNGIKNSIEEEKKNKVGLKKLFTSKVVFKQFGVAWYLLYMQQLSGIGVIGSYAQTIFESANISINAAYIPIALNIFSAFAGTPTPFLVRKYGNRILFICSSFGCSIGFGILATYFFLLEVGYNVSSISWLPIFGMFLYMLVAYIGFNGLVWAVVADLFAPSVKGYAVGISGIFSTFLGFITLTIFGLSKDAFDFGPTFLGYSITMLISSFGLYFIPNLTHMSLQEIQDYFEGKH